MRPVVLKCEKCGHLLEALRSRRTEGLFCPNCGWSVVTTYTPEIELDKTLYEILIIGGDYRSLDQVKLLARAGNMNLLAARKFLQEGSPFVLVKSNAAATTKVRDQLDSAGLSYQISPPFPW
jgi:hypothetical protein